ncbi:MAG: Rieske 2Fe-2S domain-containing protein [Verrucomicrobia bacterium]|nr:Rieske 2Fe-2S domain-containing protein [Verrucomicrobiota bacterium]
MPKFIAVAKKSEIAVGSGKCVEAEGKRIAVFNLGSEFLAIDDTCPHAGASLSEGAVEGEEVECPWHGARFKLRTGEVTAPPSEEGVAKYNVRVTGDTVEVEI